MTDTGVNDGGERSNLGLREERDEEGSPGTSTQRGGARATGAFGAPRVSNVGALLLEALQRVSVNLALQLGNLCCRGLFGTSRFDRWLRGSRRKVGLRTYHTTGPCSDKWRLIISLGRAEARGVHWDSWPAERELDIVGELCYLDLLTATALGDSWLGTAVVASVAATGSFRLFHLAVSVLSSGIAGGALPTDETSYGWAGVNPWLKPGNDEAGKNNLERALGSIEELMQDRAAACGTGLLILSAFIAELKDERGHAERGGVATPCYARHLGEFANLSYLPRWADLSRMMGWLAELGCVVRYRGSRIYITSWAKRDSQKALRLDVDEKGSVRHLVDIRLVDPACLMGRLTSALPQEHLTGRLLVGRKAKRGHLKRRRKLLGLEVKSGTGQWFPSARILRSVGLFARDRDVFGLVGDMLVDYSEEVKQYEGNNNTIREVVQDDQTENAELFVVQRQRLYVGFGGHDLPDWLTFDVECYWGRKAPMLRACIRATHSRGDDGRRDDGHRWRRLLRELFVFSLGTPAVTSDICEMILRTCTVLLRVTPEMVSEERAKTDPEKWILDKECSIRNVIEYKIWKWKETLGICGYLLMELDALIEESVPRGVTKDGDSFCRSVMRRSSSFHRYKCGNLGNPVLLGLSALSEELGYDIRINPQPTDVREPVRRDALRTISVGVGQLMTQLLPTESRSDDLTCKLVLPINSRGPAMMPEKARWGSSERLSTIKGTGCSFIGAWVGLAEEAEDSPALVQGPSYAV